MIKELNEKLKSLLEVKKMKLKCGDCNHTFSTSNPKPGETRCPKCKSNLHLKILKHNDPKSVVGYNV